MSGDLVFLTFDPYMINRHDVKNRNAGNIYPSDLESVAKVVERMSQGTIVQLSTYSTDCDNPREAVTETVRSLLQDCGLEMLGSVRAKQMTSIIFSRGISWSDRLESLVPDFQSWLTKPHMSSGLLH